MTALLFGSISTIADTSELQRAAFNEAFTKHGLGWTWEQEEYQELLTGNGGADRIAAYAEQRGESVESSAVHESKSQIFQARLRAEPITPRPGVVETIAAARAAGWQVGLVTTTSRSNIRALLEGAEGLDEGDFDLVTDVGTVDDPKPAPAVYVAALDELGEDATTCVAVEDNVGGVKAARAAGLTCVAFPNENTADHDFEGVEILDELSFESLPTPAGDRR